MQQNETQNFKMLVPIAIYAILTYLWFYLNNNNELPLIGHTDLVRGWVNEYASKGKLLFDLIYFAISTAIMIVLTECILLNLNVPFFKFEEDSALGAATFVYIIVFFYEFHVLEFRIKLIGLSIALFVFFSIGFVIADKVLGILRPILGIMDAAETISDVTNISNHDEKK